MSRSEETLAFLDCFSGVAGDMWVGALLDLGRESDRRGAAAGLTLDALRGPIASLGLDGVSLHAERVRRGSLAGTRFEVRLAGAPTAHRHLSDIAGIIERGDLPQVVKDRVHRVFQVLAEVEARVHDTTVERVHFHEVGAEDTIVDIVCAVLGCHLLGFDRIHSSAVTTGRGTIRCDHGEMPVPAPGALGNLVGIPLRSGGPLGECVTPTGAALLKVLVDEFEPRITWIPEAVGYGAGTRDDPEHPNLLRITAGRTAAGSGDGIADDIADNIAELSCNLDTITGEGMAFLMDEALILGALDVFATGIQMKKGRPGFKLTVLVDEAHRGAIEAFLLQESTSLGIRRHRVDRSVVPRWEETVDTDLGPVRFKVAKLPSGELVKRPEDAEVRRLAAEQGLGRREILRRLLGS